MAIAGRDTLKHTFGNLGLLTNALNPAVSNLAWQKKRPEILAYAALNLSKQLAGYEEWNESTIQRRGETLLSVFASIWPYPSV